MPVFFVVRATVADPAKRKAFDEWYHREHLPDAVKAFGAKKAWRFWSVSDPAVHQATYEFADQAALERATMASAEAAGCRIRPQLARRQAHPRDFRAG